MRRIAFILLLVSGAMAHGETSQMPLAGLFAFTAYPVDNWELFVWEPASRKPPRQLTHTPFDEKSPAISVDRKHIAFATTEGEILVHALDTGDTVRISPRMPGAWDSPSYAPDGRRLAAVYLPPGSADRAELAILSLGGEPPQFPLKQFGPQYAPSWSPDGRQLAFGYGHCSNACGRVIQEPWTLDMVRGNARQVLLGGAYAYDFNWSPDSNRLVFARNEELSHILMYYDFTAQRVTPLAAGDELSDSPCFSPDGRSIAFLSSRDGSRALWVFDLTSGVSVRITPPLNTQYGFQDFAWR
jgi:TolB protein